MAEDVIVVDDPEAAFDLLSQVSTVRLEDGTWLHDGVHYSIPPWVHHALLRGAPKRAREELDDILASMDAENARAEQAYEDRIAKREDKFAKREDKYRQLEREEDRRLRIETAMLCGAIVVVTFVVSVGLMLA